MAAFLMSCVAAEMALWSGTGPTVVLFLGSELFTLIIEEAWASDLIVSRADSSEICVTEFHGMPSWGEERSKRAG